MPAPVGPHRQAPRHRRLLPLGQPRPGLEPGWAVASGTRGRDRTGAAGPRPLRVHRGDGGAGPAAASTSRSTPPAVASDGEPAPRPARLRARLTGPDDGGVLLDASRDVTLAGGDNHLTWTLDVDHPPRWWPRRLGEQPRCDVEVVVEVGGEASDRRTLRTAFREVQWRRWQLQVNGERLFVMGSNQGPTRMQLGEATAAELARDVQLALDANLDLLRLHAHVSRPELYDAADAAGLLLWQDFPLQWGYARGVRKPAVRQARAMVDVLGHHPSIVLWCAHNEPLAVDIAPGQAADDARQDAPRRVDAAPDVEQERARPVDHARAAPRRPEPRRRPALGRAARPGRPRHRHALLLRLVPRQARRPRGRAARGPAPRPLRHRVRRPGRPRVRRRSWSPSGGPSSTGTACSSTTRVRRRSSTGSCRPPTSTTFDAWRTATQAYQAALVQLQVEDLRRLKYAPTGGFCHFCFADGHPAVTWSVLDHERGEKRGYAAFRDACRPVLPMIEPRAGLVHVASERRDDARRRGHRGDGRRGRLGRFTGDIAADAVTYVGRVDLDGVKEASVTLEHPVLGRVENRYDAALLASVREEARS